MAQAFNKLGGIFPKGSGKGLFGGAGALITIGALGYGINTALFNGNNNSLRIESYETQPAEAKHQTATFLPEPSVMTEHMLICHVDRISHPLDDVECDSQPGLCFMEHSI